MRLLISIVFIIVLLSCRPVRQTTVPDSDKIIVFPRNDTYKSNRIPALVITKTGALLAFCEGRISSSGDWADMNLVMKRSLDGGKTWSRVIILDSNIGAPVGNPTPIVGENGEVHLLYQRDYERAFYMRSNNDGIAWSKPVEITSTFHQFRPEYNWKVLAPGPGHGIRLKNGRLLCPVWLADSEKMLPRRSHYPSSVATIYSDDNGRTWQRGAIVANQSDSISNPNESMAVQLPDGQVMLSIRNPGKQMRRAFSYSSDGISGWNGLRFDEELFDPTCMAGFNSFFDKKTGKTFLVFTNPDSRDIPKHPRQNLVIKVSEDEGKTWPHQKVIDSGAAGYSDVAIDDKGNIFVLYENNEVGEGTNYDLVMKRFSLKSLIGK